jgi:hypothetical protein
MRSLAIYARLDRSAERGRLAVRHAIGGLLAHALRDEELDLLTGALYAAAGPVNEGGLFEWERLWFEETLPPPPATLLLGGAGYGREAVPLQRLGYEVMAFEPEPHAARRCAERLGDSGQVMRGSYQDLAAGRRGEGPLAKIRGRCFDAAIFGHLRNRDDRRQAVQSMAALARGPVLLSLLNPPASGRASAVAAGVGRRIGRARRLAPNSSRDLWFAPWCGFLARVPQAEIEEEAAALGRPLILVPGDLARATLGAPST